jgi:E3 ubiquitin-protein ligase BIG BROTHER-like protein
MFYLEQRKYLTEDLFNKLSVKKLTDLKSLPFGVEKCMICIENFKKKEELITLPCKHLYHKACIKRWLELNINCPICKADINEESFKKK